MEKLELPFAVLAAITLFLFSLQGFAREVQAHGQQTLQSWFNRVTRNRFAGFALGAVATAVVQSSSAVSSDSVAQSIAMAHLLFNLSTAVVFLVLLRPFADAFDRWIPQRSPAPTAVDRASA